MNPSLLITIGTSTWQVKVAPERLIPVIRTRVPAATTNPVELVRTALENLVGLNAPLRRALTPDDRVTIVVDEHLPELGTLLRTFLEYLTAARIDPRSVTLLVAKPGPQHWLDELPDEYDDVKVEVHRADDRDKLAYLATTKGGRRVYLNRTLVDADVVAVIGGRRFDPHYGHTGPESAVYPTLADEESQKGYAADFQKRTKETRSAARAESLEVLRLLGSTFLLQCIEGAGDSISAVVVGMGQSETAKAGVELLRDFWSGTVDSAADLVIAAISGNPGRIAYRDLAAAAAAGKRILTPNGRLVLLTDSAPVLDEAAQLLRNSGTPANAHKRIEAQKPADPVAANLWARAANQSHLFVRSGWPDDLAEELFATPLHSVGELQRLIDAAERVAILPDAHKIRVKVIGSEDETE